MQTKEIHTGFMQQNRKCSKSLVRNKKIKKLCLINEKNMFEFKVGLKKKNDNTIETS